MYKVLLLVFVCTFQLSFSQTRKISAEEAREEIQLTANALIQFHPAVYYQQLEEPVQRTADSLVATIADSVWIETQYDCLYRLLALTRCGHTDVYGLSRFSQKSFFPFVVTWTGTVLVVSQVDERYVNWMGDTITRIGMMHTPDFMYQASQFITTDGSDLFPKYSMAAFYIGGAVRQVLGLMDSVQVEINGTRTAYVKLTSQVLLNARQSLDLVSLQPTGNKTYKLGPLQPSPGLWYFGISSVQGEYKKSHPQIFRMLEDSNAQALVLDLRNNGGGNLYQAVDLLRYLYKKPVIYQKHGHLPFFNEKFPASFWRTWTAGWMLHLFHWTALTGVDGKGWKTYFENSPRRKHFFNGRILLLVNASTFSAASFIAAYLEGQENVTVAGFPTGGGSGGNYGGSFPKLNLPYSKLKIQIPLWELDYMLDTEIPGNGIHPDFYLSMPPDVDADWKKIQNWFSHPENE